MNKHFHTLLLSMVLAFTLVSTASARDAFQPAFLDTLVPPYLAIQTALAADSFDQTKTGADMFLDAVKSAPNNVEADELRKTAQAVSEAKDIGAARAAFADLSRDLTALVTRVGTPGNQTLFTAHCPMAFSGKGGSWIQADKQIANPYFGSQMLRCGEIREQIAAESSKPQVEHKH